MKVVIGISGSIAVLGIHALLARLVSDPGLEVSACMTRTAAGIVNPAALGAILRSPVPVDGWTEGQAMPPGAIVQDCDVLLIAPASATTLAWCASGAAANIVAASYLAHTGRAVFAPAMAPEMLRHPAVQRTLATLAIDGATVLPCARGFQVSTGAWTDGGLAAFADLRAALDPAASGSRRDARREAVHGQA